MLTCEECECTSENPQGWIAFLVREPDAVDSPRVAAYCPPCCYREFNLQKHTAATYI